MLASYEKSLHAAFTVVFFVALGLQAYAQSGSGSLNGTVFDPSGAVVANATVEIRQAVSGFDRTTTTDSKGNFSFSNVPFNPYHMTVMATGFAPTAQDVEVRSAVAASVKVSLQITGSSTSVTVEAGGDLVENDPTGHTDVDRDLFKKVPLESQSSSLSALVTQVSPGVSADSNGLFHGLGDHASNSFSVDGQPITDQQSKVFSNQVPLDSIESLEVIPGAPPAEYGGKTSLVIVATTRSGLGSKTPHGSVNASYGSFGSSNIGFDLAYGGDKGGNFISANGLNTGRFLDPPEFAVIHDKGNEENIFDRVDYQLSTKDSAFIGVSVPGVAALACPESQFGSSLLQVPAPNTENDDHNPPRIASRNLFDIALGDDNLFKGERYKWSLTLTAINVTNKYALYNFLSTFSGTHYVTPRALTAQLGFHF